jgi:hypothetical protein
MYPSDFFLARGLSFNKRPFESSYKEKENNRTKRN